MKKSPTEIANDLIRVAMARIAEIEKLLKTKPAHLSKSRLTEIRKEIEHFKKDIKTYNKNKSNPQVIIALGAEKSPLTAFLEDLRKPVYQKSYQTTTQSRVSKSPRVRSAEGAITPKADVVQPQKKVEAEQPAAPSPRAEGAESAQKEGEKEIKTLPLESLEEMKIAEVPAASSPRAEGGASVQKEGGEEIETLPIESLEEMKIAEQPAASPRAEGAEPSQKIAGKVGEALSRENQQEMEIKDEKGSEKKAEGVAGGNIIDDTFRELELDKTIPLSSKAIPVAPEAGVFTFTVSRDQLVDLATELAGKGFKATSGNENVVLYQKGATAYMVQRVGDEAQIKVECSVQQLAKEIRRVIDIYPSAAYTIEAEGVAAKVLEQVSYEKDLSDELEMQSDQEAARLEKASFEQVLTEVRESSITDLEELEVKTYLPPDLDKENKDLLGTRLKGLDDENLEKVQAKADDHLEKLEQWKASQGTSDVEVNQIYGRLKGNIEQFKDIAERSKKIPTLPITDLQELPAKPVPMPRKDRLTGVSPATAAQPENKPAPPSRPPQPPISPAQFDRPAPPTISPTPPSRSTAPGESSAQSISAKKDMEKSGMKESREGFSYVATLAKYTAKASLSNELASLRTNIDKILSSNEFKQFNKNSASVNSDQANAFKAIKELDSRVETAVKSLPIFRPYYRMKVREQLQEMGRDPKINSALRELAGTPALKSGETRQVNIEVVNKPKTPN